MQVIVIYAEKLEKIFGDIAAISNLNDKGICVYSGISGTKLLGV